ncbi:MAG: hypothetical protein KKH40_05715, partial [Nanoarchaeota archaeon]|nr:hypothetical protein [Nanoarchaeota archaeon]
LQEVGRNLYKYIAKKRRVKDELKKRDYIEKYIPAVAEALKEILKFSDIEEQNVIELLEEMLEQQRGAIDKMEFDENKNQEYDKDFADIGKEEQKNDEEEIEGKNNGSY